MARPVLKWVGGKRRLIEEIITLFPNDYPERAYHEPFFGGGALFFYLEPIRGSINDVNKRLINFYRVLRDNPDELIEIASKYTYEKDEYYRLRDRFNEGPLEDVEDAAILLYLNKTGFNGLYRVNSKGEYNVPFGTYKSPRIVDVKRIQLASSILKKIEINSERFYGVKKYVKKGDIVYFDPPYLPVSDTSDFTAYSRAGFGYDDHMLLKDTCVELHEKGVLFVQSNSYVQPILDLYEAIDGFRVETVQMNRTINSDASKRGEVNEVLITNIPESY
ncbi:MAG: DNA adenine methylase [Candidatus Bathyarchaeota archaeon]